MASVTPTTGGAPSMAGGPSLQAWTSLHPPTLKHGSTWHGELTPLSRIHVVGSTLDAKEFTIQDPSTGQVVAGVGIFVQQEKSGFYLTIVAGVGIFVQQEKSGFYVSDLLPGGAACRSGQGEPASNGFYVSDLLPGGAACRSGQVKSKDQLLRVGEHDIIAERTSLEQVRQYILGPIGSYITLHFSRENRYILGTVGSYVTLHFSRENSAAISDIHLER
ncbi:hypothetical protein T484DRAFT_1763984 [Baffinella frigidus]|nr:hypothetical protein T484DRAFT_1763984 [Cryptophyta sp. CCMP2293]